MSCVDIINISFHILVLTTIQFFQSDLLPVNLPRIIKLIIPCTCFYKKRYCENKYCKSQLNRYDNAHFEASEPCGCTFFLGRVFEYQQCYYHCNKQGNKYDTEACRIALTSVCYTARKHYNI